MSAYTTLPSPAPRAARLASLVVVLLVGLTGLVGLAPQATAVADATVTGRFVTEDGVPIDAIRAVVFANDTAVTEVTSGADGTFELTGLPAGSYTLEGFDWFDNYGLFHDMPFTVVDGETKDFGDLELEFFSLANPQDRLTGIVRDPAGKPVRGIRVFVRTDAPLFADSTIVATAYTDRTGRYNVQPGGPLVDGSYRLYFTDDMTVPETFRYADRYSGDQPTWARATTITIGSTQLVVPPVTITKNGGISGTLTGTVPMTNGTVTVYDVDGEQVTTKASGAGGAYSITTLRPGSYYLRFSSTDPSPAGGAKFIRTFWPGAASIAGATPVVVKSGLFKTGVNQVLSDQLVAFRKPTISGRPTVGFTLTASPGSWSLTSATEYSYEWLRGTAVIGRAKTYRQVAADAGKTLKVRVTARWFDKSGAATSASTATVKWVSAVSAKGTYKRSKKQLVLTVRVTVPGLSNPGGTVTVKEGSRTVKAGVTVRNGIAVITVQRPKPGSHTFALKYSGTTKVLTDTSSIRVTVPR